MTTETKTPIRITTGAGGGKIYMLFSEPQEQKRIEDFLTEISLGTNTKVSADISTNIDYYPDSHFTPGEPTLITNKYSIRATLFIDQITKIEIKGTSDPISWTRSTNRSWNRHRITRIKNCRRQRKRTKST